MEIILSAPVDLTWHAILCIMCIIISCVSPVADESVCGSPFDCLLDNISRTIQYVASAATYGLFFFCSLPVAYTVVQWQANHSIYIYLFFTSIPGTKHKLSCRTFRKHIGKKCCLLLVRSKIQGFSWIPILLYLLYLLQCRQLKWSLPLKTFSCVRGMSIAIRSLLPEWWAASVALQTQLWLLEVMHYSQRCTHDTSSVS